ncbi:MAG: acylneuraminate cytidylyltransferase family protein [Myxococcota bacterium]
MNVLALIPARSGSKGLRHKNVRVVGGEALLSQAIHLARSSVRRGEHWSIAVSTDSAAYAKLARKAGASIIERPEELAGDRARLVDVVLHALAGSHCDLVVLLSATTPLTLPRDIRNAVGAWKRHRVGVATVCVDTPASLRFGMRGEKLVALGPRRPGRRQEEPTCWRLNGAVYVASPRWLREHERFVVAGKSIGVAMPKQRSLDIDDADDLHVAEALLRMRAGRGSTV